MEEMFGKNKKDTNEGINKRRNKKEKKQEREVINNVKSNTFR